jgi:hypothetical protein
LDATFSIWLTGAVFFIVGSNLLSFSLAISGRKVNGPYLTGSVIALVVVLAILGAYSVAKKNWQDARTELKIDQIARALKIPEQSTKNVEITPKAILDVLDAQREAARKATINNTAFFRAAEDQKNISENAVRLRLDGTGQVFALNYWISPASAKQNSKNPEYWTIDHRKPLIASIFPYSSKLDRVLPLGSYIIEFDALNGHWVENLSIVRENGTLLQKIKVTGAKGVVRYEDNG